MNEQDIDVRLGALAKEAIGELSKLRKPIIQFCAPISTGGFGDVSANKENLVSFIEYFKNNSAISIFNQMKYEQRMDEILADHTGYDYPLLENFYKPIFHSGKIDGLIFLPLWETSTGCIWEYEVANSLKIPTCIVDNNTGKNVLEFYEKLLQ